MTLRRHRHTIRPLDMVTASVSLHAMKGFCSSHVPWREYLLDCDICCWLAWQGRVKFSNIYAATSATLLWRNTSPLDGRLFRIDVTKRSCTRVNMKILWTSLNSGVLYAVVPGPWGMWRTCTMKIGFWCTAKASFPSPWKIDWQWGCVTEPLVGNGVGNPMCTNVIRPS